MAIGLVPGGARYRQTSTSEHCGSQQPSAHDGPCRANGSLASMTFGADKEHHRLHTDLQTKSEGWESTRQRLRPCGAHTLAVVPNGRPPVHTGTTKVGNLRSRRSTHRRRTQPRENQAEHLPCVSASSRHSSSPAPSATGHGNHTFHGLARCEACETAVPCVDQIGKEWLPELLSCRHAGHPSTWHG